MPTTARTMPPRNRQGFPSRRVVGLGWLALSATALAWFTFQKVPDVASADLQSLAYLAWSVPLAAWLAVRTLAPETIGRASRRIRRIHASREAAPIRGA